LLVYIINANGGSFGYKPTKGVVMSKDRVWICEECNHIFTEEEKQVHDEQREWGHPCKNYPRSKKPHRCESYLKPYTADQPQDKERRV